MSIRRWLTKAALASAVVAAVAAAPSAAFAGGNVPFSDPSQAGSLTLCNQHGQPITSGSLLTVPFAWRAVSSERAPAGYTRATLDLFQPIQYVDPGDWSGYQLTDDAIFSNAAHPMAQATYADAPLIWPDQSMPPHWDGFYQLRMIFSAANKQPWESTYPAAVIKVTGNTWSLVQGGGSSCTDGTAVSVASFTLPKSKTAVPTGPAKVTSYAQSKKGKSGSSSGTAGGATTGNPGGSSRSGTGSSGSAAAAGPLTSSHGGNGSGSSAAWIAGLATAAALALGGGAVLLVLRRRRRLTAD